MPVTPPINEDVRSGVIVAPACGGGAQSSGVTAPVDSYYTAQVQAISVSATPDDESVACGVNATGYTDPISFGGQGGASYGWAVYSYTLAGGSDVALGTPATGDVLRYQSGKWRNYPGVDLVDGGNF